MVAYHMLHQSARRAILPQTQDKGIGVLIMFAVRLLFSQPGRLQRIVGELVAAGRLPKALQNEADPLGFLLPREGGARSVIDAAYRYCRHTSGTDVILFGTGDANHVEANVESILSPPLPAAHVQKVESLFGMLTDVGLDIPAALTSPPAP
jgi:L-galactose dehydrogenase